MSRIRVADCAVAFCLLIWPAASGNGGTTAVTVLSIPEYIAQLDTLAATLGASSEAESTRVERLVNDLPNLWRVKSDSRIFEIPTEWLDRDLRRWRTSRDRTTYNRMLGRLEMLRSEAERFQQPPADASRLRRLAEEILNSREFRNVHGPTWFDRLRQRTFELIDRLFVRVLESSAFPTISNVLVYVLLAVAGVTVAVWISKLLPRTANPRTERPAKSQASAVAWTCWLTEAEAAAANGCWREAIHFSYWCAVSFLEAKGTWSADRTRTPREYLRLLPASSTDGSALAALTRRFEPVWYGTESADAHAFAEVTSLLKKLGCLTG